MLRIMTTILAFLVIAVTLVYSPTIQDWYLYLPALALGLATLTAWFFDGWKKRQSRSDQLSTQPIPDQPKPETAEGILSIRPVSAKSTDSDQQETKTYPPPAEAQSEPSQEDTIEMPETEPDPPSSNANNGKTRFSSLPNPNDSRSLNGILEGFRCAIGGHAVGALRQISDDGREFSILGTAGLDWAKTRGDRFRCQVPLLSSSQRLAIRSVNATDLPARYLSYSFNAGVITRVAVTRIGATSIVLLIDTVDEYGLMHPRTVDLIKLFAQTLNLLFYREDPLRPRHEIISEEMAQARVRGQELALALVLLNDAESISKLGPSLIQQVEESMQASLKRSAMSHRVEKFGELLFGVFTDGRRANLEIWHEQVRAAFAEDNDDLDGGVTIGIAVLNERHTDAIAFREDARKALLEAYDRGGRTVIA